MSRIGICLILVATAFGVDRKQNVKINVKIIDRRYDSTTYSVTLPAHAQVNSDGSGYAVGDRTTSYPVTGATFALLLPDGRVAVVNCSGKYALKFDYINTRSCRSPLVDDIKAEFHGNNAKLSWPVSVDGKKWESETYTVVAIGPGPDRDSRPSVLAPAPASAVPPAPAVPSPGVTDVMVWFDEAAPGPTTEIRDVVITAKAYEGVLNILRKLRDSDTSTRVGVPSILDSNYHPASFPLRMYGQGLQVYYWDDEVLARSTPTMHLRVTTKVYNNVTSAIGHLRVVTLSKALSNSN